MSLSDEAVERARNAVRDECGSVLCAWIDMGTKRCCGINVPPHKCRCDEVARAALEASGLATEVGRLTERCKDLQQQVHDCLAHVDAQAEHVADLERAASGLATEE